MAFKPLAGYADGEALRLQRVSDTKRMTATIGSAGNVTFDLTGGGTTFTFSKAVALSSTLEAADYIQGTTGNGFVRLRGDSGATNYLQIDDTGLVTSNYTIHVNSPGLSEQFRLHPNDFGSNHGPHFRIGNNNNGSTPSAGFVRMQDKGGTNYNVWPDDSGSLRIGATLPDNANDLSGTVVGDQTSDVRIKRDVETWYDAALVRDRLKGLVLHSFRFREDGRRGDKLMYGLVIHDGDRGSWWSMNDHQENAIASLDEANLFGHLIGGWQDHEGRLARLESALAQIGA